MGLFKDSILVVGLLVMAVVTTIGTIGYLLDFQEIGSQAEGWGLTWNVSLFILLALAFWLVALRLLYRVRKAENANPSQRLTARLTNLEAMVANIVSRPGVLDQLVPRSAEGLPGLLISRAHIAASGGFIGQSENVGSVTDGGAGQRDIIWGQDYANTDYHVSISPISGQVEIDSKSARSISIRTFDYEGRPKDIELNVLAIGDA